MDGLPVNQTDVTPAKRQTTVDLILEGVNDLKRSMAAVEQRTDSALNLAFRAHQTAKTAIWMRTSWAPYVVSGLAFAMAFAACMRK